MNLLMSIFGGDEKGGGGGGGGGGGSIDRRLDVDAAASLMWRVDSWMIMRIWVMRICVMIGSRMTYPLQMYTQSQRQRRRTTT